MKQYLALLLILLNISPAQSMDITASDELVVFRFKRTFLTHEADRSLYMTSAPDAWPRLSRHTIERLGPLLEWEDDVALPYLTDYFGKRYNIVSRTADAVDEALLEYYDAFKTPEKLSRLFMSGLRQGAWHLELQENPAIKKRYLEEALECMKRTDSDGYTAHDYLDDCSLRLEADDRKLQDCIAYKKDYDAAAMDSTEPLPPLHGIRQSEHDAIMELMKRYDDGQIMDHKQHVQFLKQNRDPLPRFFWLALRTMQSTMNFAYDRRKNFAIIDSRNGKPLHFHPGVMIREILKGYLMDETYEQLQDHFANNIIANLKTYANLHSAYSIMGAPLGMKLMDSKYLFQMAEILYGHLLAHGIDPSPLHSSLRAVFDFDINAQAGIIPAKAERNALVEALMKKDNLYCVIYEPYVRTKRAQLARYESDLIERLIAAGHSPLTRRRFEVARRTFPEDRAARSKALLDYANVRHAQQERYLDAAGGNKGPRTEEAGDTKADWDTEARHGDSEAGAKKKKRRRGGKRNKKKKKSSSRAQRHGGDGGGGSAGCGTDETSFPVATWEMAAAADVVAASSTTGADDATEPTAADAAGYAEPAHSSATDPTPQSQSLGGGGGGGSAGGATLAKPMVPARMTEASDAVGPRATPAAAVEEAAVAADAAVPAPASTAAVSTPTFRHFFGSRHMGLLASLYDPKTPAVNLAEIQKCFLHLNTSLHKGAATVRRNRTSGSHFRYDFKPKEGAPYTTGFATHNARTSHILRYQIVEARNMFDHIFAHLGLDTGALLEMYRT